MAEYVTKEDVIELLTTETCDKYCHAQMCKFSEYMIDDIEAMKSANVQEKRYCRMIPLELDCRGCTDVFICTNCHQHIHLGFIRKEYSGSFCLECGAEVKDGDTE